MGGTNKAPRSRPDTTLLTYARRRGGAKALMETSQWKVQDVELSVNKCLLFPICTSKGICQHLCENRLKLASHALVIADEET